MQIPIQNLSTTINPVGFFQTLVSHMTQTMHHVLGEDHAEAFLSIVSQQLGDQVNQNYQQALHVDQLDQEQVVAVIMDFKKRIGGEFYVIDEYPDRLILGNRHCPFAPLIEDQPMFCQVTANFIGTISADNLGYARVNVDQSMAQGHDHCQITIFWHPNDEMQGQEFFASP